MTFFPPDPLVPLSEDIVEGTWVRGGVPEKLDEVHPFSSRQMRPCLQDGLKNEEGSVLVGGLGDTSDAQHRGEVEAFGCDRYSGVVTCGEERKRSSALS